ncbi:MAG: thrombospondin type 3 repeat-containing protein [Patescibacteria group bacterium]|jgi:hypothetical protein
MNINRKVKIILLISILLIAGVGAVWIFRSKIAGNNTKSNNNINENISAYQKINDSIKMQDEKICLSLKESDDKDKCLYQLSNKLSDEKYCDKITNAEMKAKCLDRKNFESIVADPKSESADCLKLSDPLWRQACLSKFFSNNFDAKKCEDFNGDIYDLCRTLVLKNLAYQEGKIELCQGLESDYQKDCENIVKNKPKDSDNDGLLDTDERSYGTDPFAPDTDKDGKKDGEEMFKLHTDPVEKD